MSKKRNYRKLLLEKTSADGTIVFRLHDTDSLSVFDSKHTEPKKNGALGGYLRFNNLGKVSPEELDALIERLEELGIFKRPAIIDFNFPIHSELLSAWLKDKESEKWIAFSAFYSAITETRGDITYTEALELVKPHAHLLEKAKDLKALNKMFRPELGFVSADLYRRVDVEALRERIEEIKLRRNSVRYARHFERFDSNVETMGVKNARSNDFSNPGFYAFSNYVVQLLTPEEFEEFRGLVSSAGINWSVSLDEEASLLLSYALVKYGASRAIDLFMFIKDCAQNAQDSGNTNHHYYYIVFKELNSYGGEKFSEETLYRAIDNTDYPVEWALMMEQPASE